MRRAAIIILITATLAAVLLSYCTRDSAAEPVEWLFEPPAGRETAELPSPVSAPVSEPEDPAPPSFPAIPHALGAGDSLAYYDKAAEEALGMLSDYGDPATRLKIYLDSCSPMKIMLPGGVLGAVYYHGMSTPADALAKASEKYALPPSSLSVQKPYISVYYRDLETGYEFGFNEAGIRDCASLAKTPYLLAILKETDEHSGDGGRYDLSAEWAYDPGTMFRPGSGVIFEMDAGTKKTWRELIGYAFTDSDNIAFSQLMYRFGYASYNSLVSSLGIKMSLDERLMSAEDCGAVLAAAFDFISGGSEYGSFMKDKMIEAKKQNNLIGQCFSDVPVCHKYGWDVGAYHDSAIVLDEHPYVIVIMTDYDTGGAEADRFFADTVEMIKDMHRVIHLGE